MKTASPLPALLLAFSVVAHAFTSSPALGAPAPRREQSGAQQPREAQGLEALRQGRRLLKLGKFDQALPLLESALQGAEGADATRLQAAVNDALGDLYARQGQHKIAVGYYRKAHELFAQLAGRPDPLKTTVGLADESFNAGLMLAKLGESLFRLGELTESLEVYARMNVKKPDTSALGVAKKGKGLFGGLSNLKRTIQGGPSLATGGEVTGAASQLRQVFELYRQSVLYATAELGAGRVNYFGGDFDAAKQNFANALAAVGGDVPLIGGLGQMRRFRVAARTSLGDVALRQGDARAALKFYTEAANGAKADQRLDLSWPAQRGTARANLLLAAQEKNQPKKQKLTDDALAAYRAALQTVETIRQGSLRADEARSTFLATAKGVYDEASSALTELALGAAPAAGAPLEGQALAYAAEAFQLVEQGRARSLLDLLNESGTAITEGVPADLLKRKQENLERQQEIAQQLTGVTLAAADAPKEGVAKLEEELDRLTAEYDSIENQIRTSSPRYASLTAAQPLSLADVQRQVLDEQTALLEYSLGAEQSYLWAVTNKGTAVFKLPGRDHLGKQAEEFRAQIVPQNHRRSILELAGGQTRGLADERGLGLGSAAAGNAGAFAAASHALYQTAVAPAAPLLAGKRLLVVADGALNYVPFQALVTAAGGADYGALPYLVKSHEIVYAPSASVVAAVRNQSKADAAPARSLLVVADPVFDAKDPRAARAVQAGAQAATAGTAARSLVLGGAVADVAGAEAASGTNLKLARLAGTRAEAQQIAALARGAGLTPDVWLDLEASEANLRARDISRYRILHVATHGLLNAERPQLTGVVLSLVGGEGDGFLRVDEVFNLKLGSPLVMLSACETGLGKERRGEGVIGLTRAFMYAGAPAVGVSLWAVADKSTADLMADFYKRLLANQPAAPPAALRAAQVAMTANKRYAAPFYWAPFVLVGDWK